MSPKKKSKKRRRGGDYPDTWDPDRGDVLKGTIVDKRDEIETEYSDDAQAVTIETKKGKQYSVWISAALRDCVWENKEEGDKIEIEYVRKERGSFGAKRYNVDGDGDDFSDEDEEDDDDDE